MAGRIVAIACRRTVAALSAAGILISSLTGPLSPAYGQVISDPKAPIQFRAGIASSGNGTPTVNIVRPSSGGVSHNQFREYNIDTRGLILNNSGLGGTSIIGGQVAPNPNLAPGGEARIILNEVTGANRSQLNGVTEVFGRKADVIVANPNGIGCVGCGFINTGTATLTTGMPIVDYEAGKVGFETRKGDITISGAGVSAPAGQMPDQINLIGRSVDVGGVVDARSRVSLTAGATRIDPASGVVSRLTNPVEAGPAGGKAIVSSSAGVIRAASIDILSVDIDTGIVLAGNVQALGTYNAAGTFMPGDLVIVTAGDLGLVAGEASGRARVQAGGRFELARDLSTAGEIAITAQDVSLLSSAGVHAGRDLKIVAQADIVSGAVLKSGGSLNAAAGGLASFSGLIAGQNGLELSGGTKVSTTKATLIAPEIGVKAPEIELSGTWVVPGAKAVIAGVDVTLGQGTAFDPKSSIDVTASSQLTLGMLIDAQVYPALSLVFQDLTITDTGVFVADSHVIDAGVIDNAGLLAARGAMALKADRITNAATGVVKAEAIEIRTGDLRNLGQILSSSTLDVLADGAVRNDGVVETIGALMIEALSYAANSPSAELAASRVTLVLGADLVNEGSLVSTGSLVIETGDQLSNSGEIQAGGLLDLTVGDLINRGANAVIDGRAAVTITSAGRLDNQLGSIYATNSLDLAAGGALGNSGLIYSAADAAIVAAALSNQTEGRLHAGIVEVDLKSGDLTNLGQIVSKTTLDVVRAGSVLNNGIMQASGALKLEALSYTANSPAAELVARQADIFLAGGLKNAGLIAATERLGLEIGRDLSNAATGEIAARTLEAKIAGDLTNLGQIVSATTLQAVIGGVLTNEGAIHSGAGMILEAAGLINRGETARIETAGDLVIRTAGNLDNYLAQIRAVGDLGIAAGGVLTNASGRIESGRDMQIVAARLLNAAVAGTDGGIEDFYALGGLTVDYSYDKDRHLFSTDHETFIHAELHEFDGQIDLDRPGVIRAGRNMILETDTLHNENGRILAVSDLSIKTGILVNDAQIYSIDHYVNRWGRTYDDDWVPFTPPSGSNVPWGVYKWNNDAINPVYYASLIDQLPRQQVTKTRLIFAGTRSSPGTTYHADGPDGPGWYKSETYRQEEIQFGTRTETRTGERGGDNGGTYTYTVVVPDTHPREWFDTAEGKAAFLNSLNLLIARGDSPVSVRGSDDVSQSKANDIADIRLLENIDAAQLLDLARLGIDPNDVPDVIIVTNRDADPLGEGNYRYKGRERVGEATVARGSVITAGSALSVDSSQTTNRGTLSGSLVVIEGGTLDNGIDGLGNVVVGSGLGFAGGSSGIVDFVLDDVAIPPLDLGQLNTRNLVSLDPNDFGNLQTFTGSPEAARLLAGAHIAGGTLTFYADPVAEAKALSEAALRQGGSHLVVDPSLSAQEQREQLYRNAAEFAEQTGARYGVALTEAQRAALAKPIVWHETRIVDGKPVLAPRLYLPSSDELLRGARGPGLIAADDLILDLGDRLKNTGTIAVKGLASISASSILNQRLADLDMRERAYAGGRGDTGLIAAGTLLMVTDGDLVNRGGAISSAGALDLRIGGSLVNETQRYRRAVDSFDLCLGNACGADAIDYNVARITAGRDLTIVADRDIINKGGELGSVTDMLLAAGGNVEFETLKDSYLTKDYHQRGFLSGKDIVEHSIVTADAAAQSLVGDVSIFAGYGVCDGGSLCARGNAPGDVILNGALISAYGNTTINATGRIAMGAVSEEVQNTFKEWGFKGLGWGSVKQTWNDIDTSVTRISGNDVSLVAKGPITGTGVKISAVNDLLMKTDDTIRLEAAQDALYFTEKGFYIGLTFPGSAGINAALQGGSGSEVLSGLAGVSPLTAKLAALANADNGLAAGLAVVNLATGGASIFGGAAKAGGGGDLGFSTDAFRNVLSDKLNPLSQFTDENGDFSLKNFGISISSWKNQQDWTQSQVSELTAGGDIVMQAGLDVLLAEGTKLVSGGDVSIDAGRDILMAALLDYAKDKSSSWGLQISFSSIGFDIAKSQGYDEQLTNASILAAGDVSLKSGRDTALLGGNITGQNVSLDVGRDLTILSPQAQGWRDGFSFGLTIALDLTSFGIRGSSENGEKAWSSGSGIVAAEDIDIKVGEDTTLIGALINATDGDIRIDTATLVSADLKDIDKYKNIGGSIGFENGGLDTLGFSYEKKEKQGVTRTTLDAGGRLEVVIHDADRDGIMDTEADKAAAEQLLASINKDAASYQEILKDSHIKLSGELDVGDLMQFGENLRAIQNYNRAQNALVPTEIEAQGPRAVDVWRKIIINGATPEQATAVAGNDPLFGATVKKLQSVDAAIAEYGSIDRLPPGTLTLIAMGQTLLFGEASNYKGGAVLVPCASNGVCQVELATYLQTLKQNPNSVDVAIAGFRNEVIDGLKLDSLDVDSGGPFRLEAAFRDLLNCVSDNPANASDDLLAAYRANPSGFQALVYRTAGTTRVNPQTVLAAVEGLAGGGSTAQFTTDMNLAQLPRSTALDGVVTVAGVLYELTPVADSVAMVQAANDRDVLGVMIAGVGFLPIAKAAKLLGKGADVVEALFKAGGDEAAELAADTVKLLPAPSAATQSLRRLAPGVASYGDNLPRIADGQTWLKGTAGNAGKVPAQIAEQLAGQNFRDFNEFREAFWTAVYNDPLLRKQFDPSNQALMKKGFAPFAPGTQQVGGRVRYEIDHLDELRNGGNVYDMNNLIIRTPINHIVGK